MSEFDPKDIRIEKVRDGGVHWRAFGKMTHIPTGIIVEFEESWNDRSGRWDAFAKLEKLVRAAGQSMRPGETDAKDTK